MIRIFYGLYGLWINPISICIEVRNSYIYILAPIIPKHFVGPWNNPFSPHNNFQKQKNWFDLKSKFKTNLKTNKHGSKCKTNLRTKNTKKNKDPMNPEEAWLVLRFYRCIGVIHVDLPSVRGMFFNHCTIGTNSTKNP